MDAAKPLLSEATSKLIELRKKPEWKTELPPHFPPVLWTGNARTEKPRVLTVAANPSRAEFLSDDRDSAIEKVERTGDFSELNYMPASDRGIRPLLADESLEDLCHNEDLQEEILRSQIEYFFEGRNPLWWFGKPKKDSSNVEGFLRGFGASYFESSDQDRRAIQIDLFPFATLADFSDLQDLAERDLFENGWARDFMQKLLDLLKPEVLIVFGLTNTGHFGEYIDSSVLTSSWKHYGKVTSRYRMTEAKQFGVPVVCLSTNLGNPVGFSAADLEEYGSHVRRELEQV